MHNVFGYDDLPEENFEYFGNFHTHGLSEYGHRELCICVNIPENLALSILNNCGMMIANHGEVFEKGITNKVLEGGYDVLFEEYPDDPVLYIILPDENNKFPQDDGCNELYKKQAEYALYISKNKLS